MSESPRSLTASEKEQDQYIMRTPGPDPEPNHPLGPLITIRLCDKDDHDIFPGVPRWHVTWYTIRTGQTFGSKLMHGSACHFWEEGQRYLEFEETPAKIGMRHGHSVRVVDVPKPEQDLDLEEVVFEIESEDGMKDDEQN